MVWGMVTMSKDGNMLGSIHSRYALVPEPKSNIPMSMLKDSMSSFEKGYDD